MMILHKPDEHRFETVVDGETAYIEYVLQGDSLALLHTVVPQKIERRGIGTDLVKYAFQYAKENDLVIKPFCSFVVHFLNKNKSYQEQLKRD